MNEMISNRIEYLIGQGEDILKTRRPPHPNVITSDYVDTGLFTQWKAASTSFLLTVFGKDHSHYEMFVDRCKYAHHPDAVQGLAILKAVKEDLDQGFLNTVEELVSADIFTDFLEIAEHLLEHKYKDPAASLTGAVLEKGLRNYGMKKGVKVKKSDDLNTLNQKLADVKIYNRLRQKEIQVWNDIRNNADHGHFEEYTREDVDSMLKGVRRFLSSLL